VCLGTLKREPPRPVLLNSGDSDKQQQLNEGGAPDFFS
jgi:hypothetical protein